MGPMTELASILMQRRDQRRHGYRTGIAAHVHAGDFRREQLVQFSGLKHQC